MIKFSQRRKGNKINRMGREDGRKDAINNVVSFRRQQGRQK